MKRLLPVIFIFTITILFTACIEVGDQDDESVVAVAPTLTEDEQYWEDRLDDCEVSEGYECEIATYREMYESGDSDAGFKIVYFYRLQSDYEEAYAMLDKIGEDYPELLGRITFYKGDVAVNQEKDVEKAKEFYLLAADEYGDLLVGGNPVGIVALKQLAAWTAKTDKEAGGQIYRRIIYEYPDDISSVLGSLQEAIFYETVGTSVGGYGYGGACGVVDWAYCLFENGEVTAANEVPEGFVSFGDSENSIFWFKLSEEDQAIYDEYK